MIVYDIILLHTNHNDGTLKSHNISNTCFIASSRTFQDNYFITKSFFNTFSSS